MPLVLSLSHGGGGGGGMGEGYLGVVVPFGSPNADPISDQHPLVVPLKTIPDFVPTWTKSIPVVRPKRAPKLCRFHGRHIPS